MMSPKELWMLFCFVKMCKRLGIGTFVWNGPKIGKMLKEIERDED